MKEGIFLTVLLFISLVAADAQVKIASVFGDHMVLQREMTVPIWGTAAVGEKVTVTLNGQRQTIKANKEGVWMVKLEPMKAGGPYSLEVSGKNKVVLNDIYVGEVWLCSGQSNMDMTVAREDRYWCGVFHEKEEVASANYPLIRVFDTEFTPRDEVQKNVVGKWEICSPQTVGHFSATAYFFARDIYEKYKVPIGLLTTAYGASTAEAWISKPSLQVHPQFTYLLEEYAKKCAAYDTAKVAKQKYADAYEAWKTESAKATAEGKDKPREPKNPDPHVDQHNPYVLFNGMVAPLIPYAIRGALWYQGESNGPTAKIYAPLMETLIADWRRAWGQGDFHFYFVQLANHQININEPIKDDPMVLVREGQLKSLSIRNTGMVVAIDNANPGDPNDIHPKNKQSIGKRLALIARTKVYGDTVTYSGPIYDKYAIEGNSIRIYFNFARGLKAAGDLLSGFAIAGEDKKFVWAETKIEGNTIVVSSPQIAKPVAVRYGWSKNPPVNLYNKAGLPASPFRTDIE